MKNVQAWTTHVLTVSPKMVPIQCTATTFDIDFGMCARHLSPVATHVLTVSPKSAKRGIRVPTTPLTTGPLCSPMRICTASPLPVGQGTHAAASSISCAIGQTALKRRYRYLLETQAVSHQELHAGPPKQVPPLHVVLSATR